MKAERLAGWICGFEGKFFCFTNLYATLSPQFKCFFKSPISINLGRTATGPSNVTVQYSLDGFATAGTTCLNNVTVSSTSTSALNTFALTSLPSGAFSSKITFRIWAYYSGGGYVRFNNFVINGNVLANDKLGYDLIKFAAVLKHHCQICAEDPNAWHTRSGFCSHNKENLTEKIEEIKNSNEILL